MRTWQEYIKSALVELNSGEITFNQYLLFVKNKSDFVLTIYNNKCSLIYIWKIRCK